MPEIAIQRVKLRMSTSSTLNPLIISIIISLKLETLIVFSDR